MENQFDRDAERLETVPACNLIGLVSALAF